MTSYRLYLVSGRTRRFEPAQEFDARNDRAAVAIAEDMRTARPAELWHDARGIAQLLWLGWFRAVHAKSAGAQEVRALLTARKLMQGKLLGIESGIRGVLRGFGLKVGPISRGRFEARIRELVDGQVVLETVIGRCSRGGLRSMPSLKVFTVRSWGWFARIPSAVS